jgi:cyclopropane-fatty-acyl-phospholipid synthase
MSLILSSTETAAARRASRVRLDGLARRLVLSRLRALRHGRLTIVEDGSRLAFGSATPEFPLSAIVTIHHPAAWRRLAFGGSVGAGEAYIGRLWSSGDLTALVRILLRNREALGAMEGGLARLGRMADRLRHLVRRNTRDGSRRNIEAHYDLGNDFYALFLDRQMMYSCAYFEEGDTDLDAASAAKIERVCRKLGLRSGDHLLEIGTGWGGLAVHAARNHGCRVTTTTISRAQHDAATRRVADTGLSDRVRVLLRDYRDLEGRYDKIVSIEMIEAVGHEYLDTYFRRCSDLLKPDGRMVLQAIVIADQLYESSRRSVDFIQRFVFPGSRLPCVSGICGSVARATDMRLLDLEDITAHYPKTLRLWRERFLAHLEEVRAQGFSEEFIRMWTYYLSYCEGGFLERSIGDVQMIFAKPLDAAAGRG